MDLNFIRQLVKPEQTKIVLLVLDGLGGLPVRSSGLMTELEAADIPNLNALISQSICGLHQPIAPGITPGSGPAHLALFGYDPVKYQIGRGVLSALGVDFDLQPQDVAARGNFCTVDAEGRVTDRRAGRIPTEKTQALCDLLSKEISLPDVEFFLQPIKEYRFLLVLRGAGLASAIDETDPLEVGEKPLPAESLSPESEKAARLVRSFVDQAQDVLKDEEPANMVLLRGFSQKPDWPLVSEVFGLKALAIAMYPMYRGVAKLVGMEALPALHSAERAKTESGVEEEIEALEQNWDAFDFFFVHVKRIDSAGEDGDFERKVKLIEEVDPLIPRILDLKPDVLIVTGDHSTPAKLKYHSWHPVPVMLWSEVCRPDSVTRFSERACAMGSLGPRIPAIDLMPIALANAGRLEKFGA